MDQGNGMTNEMNEQSGSGLSGQLLYPENK